MTTEAIKALNQIAQFEAVWIIQDAARRAARRNTHVQVEIAPAFEAWVMDSYVNYREDMDDRLRVKQALANLGMPILR